MYKYNQVKFQVLIIFVRKNKFPIFQIMLLNIHMKNVNKQSAVV